MHDIIDNRKVILGDHIKGIPNSTEAARFAIGHFLLSGLTSIADKSASVKELRPLIGNTTNRETLEPLADLQRVAVRQEAQMTRDCGGSLHC